MTYRTHFRPFGGRIVVREPILGHLGAAAAAAPVFIKFPCWIRCCNMLCPVRDAERLRATQLLSYATSTIHVSSLNGLNVCIFFQGLCTAGCEGNQDHLKYFKNTCCVRPTKAIRPLGYPDASVRPRRHVTAPPLPPLAPCCILIQRWTDRSHRLESGVLTLRGGVTPTGTGPVPVPVYRWEPFDIYTYTHTLTKPFS